MVLTAGLLLTQLFTASVHASMDDSDPTIPGLRAYFSSSISNPRHLGPIDWAQYAHVMQVETLNWTSAKKQSFYPGGPETNFAARFVGQIDIPMGGVWSFYLGSDDGSVLFIDGEPIIEQPNRQGCRTRTNFVTLDEGFHDIEVRYFQGPGHTGLVLEWDGPGVSGREVVPAKAFRSSTEDDVYDAGGDGLWAYWYDNARHASNVGQIDWTQPDSVETLQSPSIARTRGSFRVGGPSDRFAARFVGVINIEESGQWTFELGSDQSAILFIDGDPVVVDDRGHGFRWRSGRKTLGVGEYSFEIRFWEGWSHAGLNVAWKAPSESYTSIIPASAFRPGPGASNPSSGGGLRVYNHNRVRHASGVGQIDWSDYDTFDTVQNIYYPKTRGSLGFHFL